MYKLVLLFFLTLQSKMIYAYIRVSTDKQTVENQRFEVENYVKSKGMKIDRWIAETVSGTKTAKERRLGPLLKRLKKGDVLITTEISRLGRSLLEIMSILNLCLQKDMTLITTKEGYELGNNINSKVLAFAFGLVAELERNLISQRTKEALARKKSEGMKLGRQFGTRNKSYKLSGKEDVIRKMLAEGKTKAAICRKLKCHIGTLDVHIKRAGL